MAHSVARAIEERSVRVTVGGAVVDADLGIPQEARGIVLFAHGSGSSRHSSRNRYVAKLLNQAGLATLLIDLLTMEEEAVDIKTAHLRFNIGLLAERLIGATDWLKQDDDTEKLKLDISAPAQVPPRHWWRLPNARSLSMQSSHAAGARILRDRRSRKCRHRHF
jgi:putative phosphoribosyl transferase